MMRHMVWKLIRRDKKWNLWMAGLFAILFASMLLVNDIFYSVESDLLKQNQEKYGKHHGIFFDVNREEVEQAEKEDVAQDGWICLAGAYGIKGHQAEVTVGYFDPQAMKLENLSVIEGRMPEKMNEIAVEKSRIVKFGKDVSVGKSVILRDSTGKEKIYRISGIVEDFSGAWEVPDNVVPGKTSLPEVLIREGACPINTQHYLFQMKWDKFKYESSQIWDLADQIGVESNHVVCNQKTYVEGMNVIQGLYRIQIIFLIVLILAVLMMEVCLLPVYSGKYEKAYDTFWLNGMKTDQLLHLKIVHYAFLMGIAGVLTISMYVIISALIWKIWIPFYVHHTFFGIPVAILLLLAAGLYFFLHQIREVGTESKIPCSENQNRIFLVFSYGIRKGWKSMVFSLILGCLLFVSSFYSLGYLHDYDWGDWNQYADFSIQAERTSISIASGDFWIYRNLDSYFTFQEAEKLQAMEGVSRVRKIPYTDGISLNLEENQMNEYWKQFYEEKESVTNIVSDHGEIPIYDIDFCLLSENELEKLEKKDSQEFWQSLRKKDAAILILPKTENGENHGMKKGMKVKFERIGYDKKLDFLELKRSDISEEVYSKSIVQVLTHPLKNGELDINLGNERPAVIFLETNTGKLIKGYGGFDVYIDADITKQQYGKISETMKEMAAKHTDFSWFSKQEQQEENRKVSLSIKVPLIIFGIAMSALLFFLKYISYRMHQERIKDAIRIFWIYGIKETEIYRATFMEISCYEGMMLLISLLVSAVMLWMLAAENLLNYLNITGCLTGICVGMWFALCIVVNRKKYWKNKLLFCRNIYQILSGKGGVSPD